MHLFLSPREGHWLAGALAGDVLHGQLDPEWPDGVRRGVRLHRRIDAFSDQHPALRQSRARLAEFRHHARIIVDVFYDHYLALDFERWSGGETLNDFAADVYRLLHGVRGDLPPKLVAFNDRMIDYGWLTSYGEFGSVERSLFHLSGRLKRRVDLATSVRSLREDHDGFRSDFSRFMPEVRQLVADFTK